MHRIFYQQCLWICDVPKKLAFWRVILLP